MTADEAHDLLTRMFAVFTDANATADQIDGFFAPDFVQKVDGKELNRAGFLQHFEALRTRLATLAIALERFVSDGRSAATVHVAKAVKKSGHCVQMKVIAFYEFANGRIRLIDELTLLMEGDAADRDLGSVLPQDGRSRAPT